MRILLSYPTEIGYFDIGQTLDKKYHPIFNDTSLGTYDSLQEAVDALVENKTDDVIHPETSEVIDTSTLGILSDYTQWDMGY